LEQSPERAGQTQLEEERHASAAVTRSQRPVAPNEPPALGACLSGNGSEQTVGLGIREGEQREVLIPVEPRDDPRRPAAELSAAGVEENRAWKLRGRYDGAIWNFRHPRRLRPPLCRFDGFRHEFPEIREGAPGRRIRILEP
jgi:hypothetical protein